MLLSRTSVPLSIVLGSAENRGGFDAARAGNFLRAEEKTNEKIAPPGKFCISGKRGTSTVSVCESGRGCITRR